MIVNFLGFDVEKYIKGIFAPYAKILSIVVFLITAVLSIIVLVPSIRDATGFVQWNDLAIIATSLTWLIGVIVSFVLTLQYFGITLSQFGNFVVALDVCILVALIAITWILPGQQICGMGDSDCNFFDNIIWIFSILQIPILGIYMRIKLAYATGLDPLLILRRIFGSKS